MSGDVRQLVRIQLVPADPVAELVTCGCPTHRRFVDLLGHAETHGGDADPAGVERRERNLKALANLPDDVLCGYANVGQPEVGIFEAPEPHELTTLHDLNAGGLHGYDESGNAPIHFCHQGHVIGYSAVGAPELLAVDAVVRAVVTRFEHRGRRHVGRIGAGRRLGEGKGRDLTLGQQRQVPTALLLGAEQDERLGDADRLVGREDQPQGRADAGHQLQDAVVVRQRQSLPAVLLGNLETEAAELRQTVENLRGECVRCVRWRRGPRGCAGTARRWRRRCHRGAFPPPSCLGKWEEQLEFGLSVEQGADKAGMHAVIARSFDLADARNQVKSGHSSLLAAVVMPRPPATAGGP